MWRLTRTRLMHGYGAWRRARQAALREAAKVTFIASLSLLL